MLFQILIIFALLLVNGLFAMCEIALVSSRRLKLEQLAAQGNKNALIALELLKRPVRFFSAIQTGITAIGIVAGVYGGEAFADKILDFLNASDLFGKYAREITFTIIVIIITYFSLIIGELVPKTIALNNPERITMTLAPFMNTLTVLLYPVVLFLSASTKVVLKVLFIKEKKIPQITEEELKYMIDTGSRYGIIEKAEGEIMQSVFKFGDQKAEGIMTEKKHVDWLDLNKDKTQLREQLLRSTHTKFPVCNGFANKITGVITISDALKFTSDTSAEDLKYYLSEPIIFSPETSTLEILDSFRKRRIHIGFVFNDAKELLGLITLHDLIENIVGELPEEVAYYKARVIVRPDGSLLADGAISIEALNKKTANLPIRGDYENLIGLIKANLRSPKTGDTFTFSDHVFEILDMDGKRIDKVLITPKPNIN